jgi:hypothetical protein
VGRRAAHSEAVLAVMFTLLACYLLSLGDSLDRYAGVALLVAVVVALYRFPRD